MALTLLRQCHFARAAGNIVVLHYA